MADQSTLCSHVLMTVGKCPSDGVEAWSVDVGMNGLCAIVSCNVVAQIDWARPWRRCGSMESSGRLDCR
jgi:hypothetical protein